MSDADRHRLSVAIDQLSAAARELESLARITHDHIHAGRLAIHAKAVRTGAYGLLSLYEEQRSMGRAS